MAMVRITKIGRPYAVAEVFSHMNTLQIHEASSSFEMFNIFDFRCIAFN